jgi:hypothetical protein
MNILLVVDFWPLMAAPTPSAYWPVRPRTTSGWARTTVPVLLVR